MMRRVLWPAVFGFLVMVQAASAQVTTSNCHYAGVSAAQWGSRLLATYSDAAGRGVEVWCTRSMFSAHYDIRVSWSEAETAAGHPQAVVRRVKTVAGCYFIHGDNEGPVIAEDAAHGFARVTWTNRYKNDNRYAYVFSYDWITGKLTITATVPGKPALVRVVDPPDTFQAMHRLLPEP
jgi:hypothetical protein